MISVINSLVLSPFEVKKNFDRMGQTQPPSTPINILFPVLTVTYLLCQFTKNSF